MASNSFVARTHDSTHLLIETEDDLLKPINVNRTNPNLANPFVLEHNIRLAKISEENVDDTFANKHA